MNNYRFLYGEQFYYVSTQTLPPPDEECVEVIRLKGYVYHQINKVLNLQPTQELWISLTGRNVDDHDSIVIINKRPKKV